MASLQLQFRALPVAPGNGLAIGHHQQAVGAQADGFNRVPASRTTKLAFAQKPGRTPALT